MGIFGFGEYGFLFAAEPWVFCSKRGGGGKTVRRIAVVVAFFALLLVASAVASAIALGPTKAAEVGNNPNVFINPANQKTALNTPRGDKSALDRITWYENQIIIYKNVSNSNGITNNVGLFSAHLFR